jgi:hypothetical protein
MREDEFIVNAARLQLSEKNVHALKDISENGIDWGLFEKKICTHCVSALLYHSLHVHNCSHLLPPSVFRKLQDSYYRTAARNTIFLHAIDRVARIAKGRIVLLKGADLAQTIYPNIALRSMCDIDILTEKERAEDIWNDLVSNGFTLKEHYYHKSEAHRKSYVRTQQHLHSMVWGQYIIEVHWNLFERSDLYNVTESAWKKAIPLDPDKGIFRLSSEFLLIHLCSHFSRHLDTKNPAILRMLCDLNELLLKESDTIDWIEVDGICTDCELKAEVSTALSYVHLLMETPVPTEFIDRTVKLDDSMRLASLSREGNPTETAFHAFFSDLRSLDETKDILQYLFRTIVPSREWISANFNSGNGSSMGRTYVGYFMSLLKTYLLRHSADFSNAH